MPVEGEVFLSYAGADRDMVTRLKEGLVAAGAGFSIWQDIDQIRGADNWLLKLEQSLQASGAYLILVGGGGIHKWVKFELYLAIKRHFDSDERFPILPLLLPGVTPDSLPSFLSIFQAEQLTAQPSATDYRRLAGRLQVLLTGTGDAVPVLTEADGQVSPWPGLESYDEKMERYFFGRPTETLDALRLLGDARDGVYRRWLQIEGPSGAGKSSLVHAGLIPAIQRGWFGDADFETSGSWHIAKMRPGADPVGALAVALAVSLDGWRGKAEELKRKLSAGSAKALKFVLREEWARRRLAHGRFLLVIDQFEELFASSIVAGQRQHFDALCAAALDDPDGPLHLITTVRSDFTLNQQEQTAALSSLLNRVAERYVVNRIGRMGLRDVIRSPARLAGVTWSEPSLPARIETDAADTPDPLPLVSNLLKLMWQRRDDRKQLLGTVYQELDGVGGALSKGAEILWKSLDEDSKARARNLLLKLVSIGRNRRSTRRTISRATALIAAGGGAKAEEILARLSGAAASDKNQAAGPRLIVVRSEKRSDREEHVVDLAHEALLSRWDLLKAWLDDPEVRKQLEAENTLEEAALIWERDGKPDSPGLPEPRLLARYRSVIAPSPVAQAYLQVLDREQRQRERASRWRRIKLSFSIAALFLVSLGYLGWTVSEDTSLDMGLKLLLTRYTLYTPEPEMVEIPAGSFQMGTAVGEDSREQPAHKVTIKKPFLMGKYEVMFVEYEAYARLKGIAVPSDGGWGRGRRPVINVSWEDAQAYARWLSERTRKRYRLPTEAEWEYAARAGTTTRYWWGNDIGKNNANCYGCSSPWNGRQPSPVGSFQPNAFGLHDMLGNVWEWVQDCWHDNYEGAPTDGSAWGQQRGGDCTPGVFRGGSWLNEPRNLRLTEREGTSPSYQSSSSGFRLAQDE